MALCHFSENNQFNVAKKRTHTFKNPYPFWTTGSKKKQQRAHHWAPHRCLRYTTLGHSAGGGQSAAGGGIFPPLETVDFLGFLGTAGGSLHSPFGGDQKMQTSVVILRDFPLIVHIVWVGNVMTPVLLLENSWTNSAVRDDSHTLTNWKFPVKWGVTQLFR